MADLNNKTILAIETATPVCSVALRTSAGRLTEKRTEGKGVHSERTFLFIKELLDRSEIKVSDLDQVLFSNGPGSYTGLRIGAAAIKGLLFGRSVSLLTCPTLLSFAAGILPQKNSGSIHCVIDARREHLYWQNVKKNGDVIGSPQIVEISALEQMVEPGDVFVGTGWERLTIADKKKIGFIGSEGISAVNLIKAYNHKLLKKHFSVADPEHFEPDYLTMSQINNSPIQG
jgi:tRNA threonylcarbamoyladenosine biosynthesis protein TsaB